MTCMGASAVRSFARVCIAARWNIGLWVEGGLQGQSTGDIFMTLINIREAGLRGTESSSNGARYMTR